MKAYYSDGRGRYGTGESYDYFYKYDEEENPEICTSSDGLWTYDYNPPEGCPDGIEVLRYNGCETNIIIPQLIDGNNVVSLDSTFDGFYELESVVVPEGVVYITGAFYGCENLKNIALPQSLKSVEYAFNCCFSLEKINIPAGVENFSNAFAGTKLESFTFPQGTKDISNSFEGSNYIRKVVIPGSVVYTDGAFADCENLSEAVIEDGVEILDDYMFHHCTSLLELVIPESVQTFGKSSVGYMEIREYTDPGKMGYKLKGECIVPGFHIKGVKNSEAECYAKDNGIPFIEI
ncbi:MAG: leucine-rich repeat protein [Lachnospiraceae bacterium]|nr:leucine-rich repeat protein [Lachnospiraceae bacterium]